MPAVILTIEAVSAFRVATSTAGGQTLAGLRTPTGLAEMKALLSGKPRKGRGNHAPQGQPGPRPVSENSRQVLPHFRASCGAFAASWERAEKRATRWLCWQSEPNSSLPGETQGNFAKL